MHRLKSIMPQNLPFFQLFSLPIYIILKIMLTAPIIVVIVFTYLYIISIKTRSNLLEGIKYVVRPKKTGRAQTGVSMLTGITKSRFSRIHRSVIFYPKNTKFAVEVRAYNRKLHSKVGSKSCQPFPRYKWPKFRFLFYVFFLLILLLFAQTQKSL